MQGGVQTLAVHTSSEPGQLPQLTFPPQPSSMLPQLFAAQTLGVHFWQTFETQIKSVPQAPLLGPHVSLPPQPSSMLPQL